MKDKNVSVGMLSLIKDYSILMKFTLSFTVVFSCVICYLLAPNVLLGFETILKVIELFFAGLLVTGAANAINQGVEKDTDALMKRTSSRPVASGRMSQQHAFVFAAVTGISGVVLMCFWFNLPSAIVSAFSLFLYSFVYTPLKKVSSIAVLVGAFPGALPCLIGWVAATGVISPFETLHYSIDYSNAAGWALFGIQFLWQFPHFWAIAWVAHGDYSKAGFKLLPAETGPTKFAAIQTIMYTLAMILVGLLPYYYHISGIISLIIVTIGNLALLVQCIRLYLNMDVKSARRVMFTSYIYLPVVFLAFLFNKL